MLNRLTGKLTTHLNKVEDGAGGGGGDDLEAKIAAAVAAALPKALNGAITSHLKRLETKIDERIKPLEAKATPAGDGDPDDPDAAPDGGTPGTKPKTGTGALSPEVESRLKAAEKRAERAEKAAAEEKAIREKAVAEGKVREERSALQDALTAAGVKGKMLGPAVAFLYGEQKKVKRTADDKIVWADGDDELDIAEGVKAWAKSEDGLGFMPARDVGGSGGTGGGRGGAGGGGSSQAMSDAAFIDALVGNAPGR